MPAEIQTCASNTRLFGGRVHCTFEGQITALAEELFQSKDLTKDTEFHADSIYRAKDNFRGKTMADRATIIGRLAKIIGENEYISKVYAAIDSAKIFNPDQAAEFAFAHFVERVQMCVWDRPCVLIGDQDDLEAKNMVRDFAQFRARGTPWAHGIEIKTVVDTVHFGKSHHSRLIQHRGCIRMVDGTQMGTSKRRYG